MLPAFAISLAVVVALQVILSACIYFTPLQNKRGPLLLVFVMNLVLGFVVPWYIGRVMWDFATGIFHLSTDNVLYSPLTGANALTLFVTIAVPILYFKGACIPLVRDANMNYRNQRKADRAKKQAKPTRLENSSPYERNHGK